MVEDEIDPLLDRMSRSGEFDSRGEFTLNPLRAIQKLAASQLPDRSLWILKIVQAAVAGGCQGLTIRQEGRRTLFRLAEPQVEFSLERLYDALLRADPLGVAHLDHLVVGLRTVGLAEGRSWTLTTQAERLSWDGGRFVHEGDLEGSVDGDIRLEVMFRLEQTPGSLRGMFGRAGVARDEYLHVVRRAHVCPIPLTFDGRRLDCGEGARQFPRGTKVSNLCFGVAPPSQDPALDLLAVPGGVSRPGWRLTDRFMDGRIFFLDGDLGQARTSAFFQFRYAFSHSAVLSSDFEWRSVKEISWCHWVSHGVVVDQTRVKLQETEIFLDLYLPADGLIMDVSTLSLRSTQENGTLMLGRRREGMVRLVRSAESTRRELSRWTAKPFDGHVAYMATMALPFVPYALLGASFFFFGITALLSPIGIVSLTKKRKLLRGVLKQLERLSADLESLMEE